MSFGFRMRQMARRSAQEPYFDNLVLGIHCDNFLPTDIKGKSASTSGGAALDTGTKQFGTGSIRITDSAGPLYYADSPDWHFGAGNFAIRGWICFASFTTVASYGGAWNYILCQQDGYDSQKSFSLYRNGNSINFEYSTTGTNVILVTAPFTFALTTQYYVEVSRVGSDLRLFVGGLQQGAIHNIGSSALFNSPTPLHFGRHGSGSGGGGPHFDGWIDDFEIIKGSGGHTSDYVVPTTPFPDA